MPRLFATSKEIQFIQDLGKEFIKDIVGQKIYYYPISTLKTNVHKVYDEAVKKIFENPIKLDVLVGQPEWETKHNAFGAEQTAKFEVLVQARDLIDKGLHLSEGDYFTYDDAVFEIQSYVNMDNIFGQVEYENAYKIVGRLARPGTFDPKQIILPTKDTKEPYLENGVQTVFVQQRGLAETEEGATGDVRQLRERLGDEMEQPALGHGPRKVGPDETKKVNTFYDE